MSYHLKELAIKPLEREYEGWISNEIENYFKSFGVDCDVLSISPHGEKIFPSDMSLFFRGKLLGLQLKRTYHKTDIKDLFWKFSKRKHDLIINKNLPIYYAVPTF
jgi:hypothetical protein